MIMDTTNPSSSSEITSPPAITPSSNSISSYSSHLHITSHKLNGYNYLQWSQSVMMYVCGKGREDHLTRTAVPLNKENAARGPSPQTNDTKSRRGRPSCHYSRRPGHTKETCWKIHNKPNDWKPSRSNNAPPTQSPFSKNQLNMLHKLISQAYSSSSALTVIGTGGVAQRGNISLALRAAQHSLNPYILDSGAFDHMTGDKQLFTSYSPCTNATTVRIADGSCSKVAGMGTIHISQDLILHSVLFVPKLDCNLLSVSKLNSDLNCTTKFFAKSCVFQDLVSGKTIGSAELCAGLYIFKVENPPRRQVCNAVEVQSHNLYLSRPLSSS